MIKAATALLAVVVVVAGCGGGDSDKAVIPDTTNTTTTTPADDGATTLYFTSGEQFRKVERKLPGHGSEIERATEALVAGPTKQEADRRVEAQTLIPDGVEVRDVSVSDDGTATVELSPRFLAGIPEQESKRTPAQEQALDARLGQMTYTLTQFAKVQEAKVVSGGVGVEPPLDRADYAKPPGGAKPKSRPRGITSTGTRQVQQRLAKLRYLPKSAVDGVNGYRTQQAVIAFQSWEGLGRDGGVGPITRAALKSARRPKPRGSGDERRIEVFRDRGVALLIKNGRTKRAVHVSTGAPGTATPAGTFAVFRKEEMSWSVPFSQWLPWASYFFQGIAFHEYPDVPAYPASHGCVRVPRPEAQFLYRFAKIGRRVVVY